MVNGFRVKKTSSQLVNARHGMLSEQKAVVFSSKRKFQEEIKTMEEFEDFVNEQLDENTIPRKAGFKIQYKVDITNRDGDRVSHFDTVEFRDMDMAVEMEDFKLSNYQHEASDAPDELFDMVIGNDVKKIHRKFVMIYRYKSTRAGQDVDNECFYNCLKVKYDVDKDIFNSVVSYGKMTRVNQIPELEELFKVNVNVINHYTSQMKYDRTVQMTLFNQHYELVSEESKPFEIHPLKALKWRRIVLYNKLKVVQMTKAGLLTSDVSMKEMMKLKELNKFKVICLLREDSLTDETWEEYNDMDRWLRKWTKKNLTIETSFTQFNSIAEFSVALWSYVCDVDGLQCATLKDEVVLDELKNSSSAMIQKVSEYAGPVLKLDFNSFYPSLMMDSQIPLAPPCFHKPSNEYMKKCTDAEREKYGLEFFFQPKEQGWYNVEITNEELNKETPRRFPKSKSGYYTREEVKDMQKHRYKFKLTSKRAILFDKEVKRKTLFKEFFQTLYALKIETGNKICKRLMNCLLGKLATKNYRRAFAYNKDKDVLVKENEELVNAKHRQYILKNYQESKYMYAPWIQNLVYGRARHRLNELIDEVGRENVLAVKTDCVVVKNKGKGFITGLLSKFELSNRLGDLKIDK